MKTAARWIKALFGRKRRGKRYVMSVLNPRTGGEIDAIFTYLKLETPVITAAQYNKLPDEVKRLFVKVGK